MPPEYDEDMDKAVDRFWDQLAQGRPSAAGDLDPADAATIRYLHTFDDRPGPGRDFTQRLREDLMHAHMHAHSIPGLPHPGIRPLPHELARRRQLAQGQGGRALAWLATAALLLLTLVSAYFAFGPPRADRMARLEQPTVAAPALIATPATPAPSPTAEGLLVEFTLPQGIPGEIIAGMNAYTIPPGSTGRWEPTSLSATCCTGPRLNYIVDGEYTVRSEGPMRLLRGGGTGPPEEIPAGTEIVLGPGDALLSEMGDPFEASNAGATPVVILDGGLFAGNPGTDPIPAESSGRPVWVYQDQDIMLAPLAVPPGPVALRVQQATLEPGDVRPRPPGAILQLAVTLERDSLVLTESASNERPFDVSSFEQEPVTIYALILAPVPAGDGSATAGTPAA
jgi:hypothetical protein